MQFSPDDSLLDCRTFCYCILKGFLAGHRLDGTKAPLRLVELLLALLAARALPVLRKLLEGHAVMLGRIIDIATDGADVLSRSHVGNKIMCDCFLFAK